MTGVVNLAAYVGVETGIVGRIQLTVGSNAIPGVNFNGQFLLEINTFAAPRTIQTFGVQYQTIAGVERFNGFKRDANHNLVVEDATLSITGGFRLLMGGEVKLLSTLTISGEVQLEVSTSQIQLIINGTMDLNPIGTVTLSNTGFRLNADGLVARFDFSVGTLGQSIGLGFTANAYMAINTTGTTQDFNGTSVAVGFRVRIDGSINLIDLASGQGSVDITISPAGFQLQFALGFTIGGLAFRADGGAAVVGGANPGFAMTLNVSAKADATVFSIDAAGTLQLNTSNATLLGIAPNSFLLRLTGTVSILKIITFDAALLVEVNGNAWHLSATASLKLFGLVGLSGSVSLWSNGSFDVSLHGYLQIGSSSFGIRGDFNFRVASISRPDGTYYFSLSVSAEVKVRAFGFTLLGVGISASFAVDTANVSSGGRVKVELAINVRIKFLFWTFSKTAYFTLGYLQLPVPTYLAGNAGSTQAAAQSWSGGTLVLNTGERAQFRNIAVLDTSEEYRIEQLSSAASGATIKVTAFGRSNTYAGVTSIVGNLGAGNDQLFVDPSVSVPVTIDAGADDDLISVEGSGTATVSGGTGADIITASGTGGGDLSGGDGDDLLQHTGTGAVTLHGGGDNDRLLGNGYTAAMYGDAGNDDLEASLAGTRNTVMDGGAGQDSLLVTLTGGADTLGIGTASRSGQDAIVFTLGGASRTATGVEELSVEAGAGGDTLTVDDLAGDAGITTLTLVLGTGSADAVVVRGSAGADSIAVNVADHPATDIGTELRVVRTGAYTVWVTGAVRSDGDSLTIEAGAGNDTIDASGLTTDRAALTLRGEADADRLIGSPFADRLDSGLGDDIVTGGAGQDVFTDAGGTDTIVETVTQDVGLYNNLLVLGTATGTDFLAGATAEDLGSQFELAVLTGTSVANSFLIGDADGQVAVGAAGRSAQPWTGTATLNPLGGADLIRVELRGAGGATTTVTASEGDDTLQVLGTSQREDVVVSSGEIKARTTTDAWVTLSFGVEHVLLDTLGGGDRVAVRSIVVPHLINTGTGDDQIDVGSTAGPDSLAVTDATWSNVNGTLNAIAALLTVDGGTSGELAGNDVLTLSDAVDVAANTGTVTKTTVTGLGMSDGVVYLGLEALQLTLGSGGDTLIVRGTSTLTTSIDTGLGPDTVRFGSGPAGLGGDLTGIAGQVTVNGNGGSDTVVLDSTGSNADLIGTLSATRITGLGLVDWIDYLAAELLQVFLGSGSDTLAVTGTSATTGVWGNAGIDRVTVNPVPDPSAATANALLGRLRIDGGSGADVTTVNLWGNGNSRVDVVDDAAGQHTVIINGTGISDTLLLRANANAGLVALLSGLVSGQFTAAEQVTHAVGITTVELNTLGGDDRVALDDTAAPLSIDLGTGGDLVRIGQLFTSYVGDAEFPMTNDFSSTRGDLSRGVSHATSIAGNSGNDIFEVFHNRATLSLSGGDDNDIFVVRTFASSDSLTAINAGAGSDLIRYAVNAPVTVDGGGGNDLVILVGDESNNVFIVTANGLYGSGITLTFTAVERVSLYGQQGNDIFYVLSTAADVAVSIFGGLGSDQVLVAGGASSIPTRYLPVGVTLPALTTLADIAGALTVVGGNDPAPEYAIELDAYLPILLPGEFSGYPLPVTATTGAAIESAQVDELVLNDSASLSSPAGTVTAAMVTGLGMGVGVSYTDLEVLALTLGSGNDHLVVEATHAGTTEIAAGGGTDTLIIRAIDGHTRVDGGAADDTIRVGTAAGLLDLLAATLLIDGGPGNDTVTLDDSGDGNDNLGWLTKTTVTGLDMIARAALDAMGRPLDLLYSLTPLAGVTSFTLTLSRLVGGVASAIGQLTVAVGTAASALAATLQAWLFPDTTSCGLLDETPCAPSVYVWQAGAGYLIGFRGEVNEDPANPRDIQLIATGAGSAIDGLQRMDGVTYAGVETLNLDLGLGSDVLNVRGTTAVTNVSAGPGDDRIYVSSIADVPLAGHPDLLGGVLDDLLGTLNLSLGSGHHTLQISDVNSLVGDGNVLITDQIAAARLRDAAIDTAAEIAIVGLAPAGISYRAAADGDLAGGVRIWSGYGADTITIDGTFHRPALRTTTWLNTGLGNDAVTVTLTDGADGHLVLNTQGPDLASPSAADDDVVDASGSTLGLVVFGGQGNDSITTGSGADLVIGDRGLVLWFAAGALPDFSVLADGVLTVAEYAGLLALAVGAAGHGGPGDFSRNTETLVGLVLSTDPAVAGADLLTTGVGPDIVLGGTGADVIDSGAGDDVAVGDLGYLAQTLQGGLLQRRVSSWGNTLGGSDTLRGGADSDVLVGGVGGDRIDGGAGTDLLFGDNVRLDQSWSLTPTGWNPSFLRITLLDHDVLALAAAALAFGDDYLAGGAGNDVIFGQLGDDTIQGDGSIDLTVGAHRDAGGHLVLTPSALAAGDGDDYIEAGGGADVVFGNGGSDDIIGGSSAVFSLATMLDRPDGNDLLFGGAGTRAGRNDDTAASLADSDVLVGDNGYILRAVPVAGMLAGLTGVGSSVATLLGGRALRVVVLLDHTEGGPDARPWLFLRLTAAQVAGSHTGLLDVWGSDELHGEAGDDALYGGGGNDVLYGDAGSDSMVGGWGHDWMSGGTGADVMFGDEVWHEGDNLDAAQPAGVAYSSDVMFGGWDDDVMDGGWGDDAVSGAEALGVAWARTVAGQVVETGWDRPFNAGTLLGFNTTKKGRFDLFDKKRPNRRITLCPDGRVDPTCATQLPWFLNNDATDGRPGASGVASDGADLLMGRAGSDWVVGGTGMDVLWGGRDRDVVQADDDLSTNNGENTTKETIADYVDVLVGGSGDDEYLRNSAKEKISHTNGGALLKRSVPLGSFRGHYITVALPKPLLAGLLRVALNSGLLAALVPSAGQRWLAGVSGAAVGKYTTVVIRNGVTYVPLQVNFRSTPDPAALAASVGALWQVVRAQLGGTTAPLSFVLVPWASSPLTPLPGLRVSCQAGWRFDITSGACFPVLTGEGESGGVCSASDGTPGLGCRPGVEPGRWWLWRDPAANPNDHLFPGPLPGCSVSSGGSGSGLRDGLWDPADDRCLSFGPGVWPV
ncbi:MAG: calcium-binding protein [Propionicimonas sp.]